MPCGTTICGIKTNEKLAFLRLVLFFHSGAVAAVAPYVAVFLKQRGLSIAHLSVVYSISPAFQFLGPVISGIVADKIGRSKPVLFINVLLFALALNCMLLIPDMSQKHCQQPIFALNCTKLTKSSTLNIPNYEVNQTENENSRSCSRTWNASGVALKQEINAVTIVKKNDTSLLEDSSPLAYHIVLNSEDIVQLTTNYSVKFANRKFSPFNVSHKTSAECIVLYTRKSSYHCLNYTASTSNICTMNDRTIFFITSYILVVFYYIFSSTCFRFMEVTSMTVVKAQGSFYGHERIFSTLGAITGSLIAGCMFTFNRRKGRNKDYSLVFYVFDAAIIITMIALLKLDVHVKPRGKRMWRKGIELMKNRDTLIFIVSIFLLGTCYIFSLTFPLLFLDSLDAPGMLFGLNHAMKNIVTLPFLFVSKAIVGKIGSVNMPLLSFAAYVVFFTSYSFLVNPWWSTAIQCCYTFMYYVLWIAVVMRSHDLAPTDMTATIMAMLGSTHHAIGKGAGSALGGFTMTKYGGRVAMRLMATFAGVSGIFYGIYLLVLWKIGPQKHISGTEDKADTNGIQNVNFAVSASVDIKSFQSGTSNVELQHDKATYTV